MKVLMFGWEFPPWNSGGLGVACFGLTKALAAQNINITFVLPMAVDIDVPFLRMVFANSNIKFLPFNSLLSPYLTSTGYTKRLQVGQQGIYSRNLLEEVYRYGLSAREIAREEEFDLIHAHDWLSFEAGINAKEVSGKPLIVHVHATEFDRSGEKINQEIYQIEKEGLQKADAIVAVSDYTKKTLVQNYGIDPQKIDVVWNGINLEDFQNQTETGNSLLNLKKAGYKIVIFVGRLTFQKGPDYFLLAAKKVIERDPMVRFVIAGSGDMENQIIQQSIHLGISDKILFAGFLRGDELNKLYQAADLYVLSSVSEPFGITTLESLANGTPVLISKQSGASEALTHALKVDFWDTDEMAAKILAVTTYPSLQHTLSTNGQSEVQKFSWQRAAQKCANIYQRLASQRRV